MRDVTLKGLRARRRRSLSIVVAVVLGVGLMVGGLVLTDTINASFEKIFAQGKDSDVIIRGKQGVDQAGPGGGAESFSVSALDKVRSTPGVQKAQGGVFYAGTLLDSHGDRIGSGFAPSFLFSSYDKEFESLDYLKGHPPEGPRQISLDQASAKRAKVRMGDEIYAVAKTEPVLYRVVGLTKFGDISFGGASFATLTLPEAKRITGQVGRLDRMEVAADPGVGAGDLADRLDKRLPRQLDVSTTKADADSQLKDIKQGLSFLSVVLAVFGFVSLFVGSFVIFNTFAITVAQRISEFGLLRILGASRRQILASVMLEATLIGVAGSVAGIAAGVGFAYGIQALFRAFGIDLPSTGTVLTEQTVATGFILGMVVTLISALVPAIRARRVSPLAALREQGLSDSERTNRVVVAVALALTAAGVAVVVRALLTNFAEAGDQAIQIGLGSVGVLFGVALVSPALIRPVAAAVGLPIQRLRGITGRLARENAVRKPGRTAATAAALMIGLALVSFVTIIAAGINASVANTIEENFAGELIVQNLDGLSPIPADVIGAVRHVKGVKTVSPSSYANVKVRGVKGEPFVSALDPKTVADVFTLDWVDGSQETLDHLKDGQIVVDQAWATSKGFETGDTVSVKTANGEHHDYEIAGSLTDNSELFGAFILTNRAMDRDFGIDQPAYGFVALEKGAKTWKVQDELKQLLRDRFPSAVVRNQKQLGQEQFDRISGITKMVYALLSLAVLVSLFGIANTMSLSILERTRELGMLRAIGTMRSQVREMVTLEAVITALIGAVLGLALGIAFAALMSQALASLGFSVVYPALQLALMFVLAAVAGAVASIGPAARAANIDVLDAVAYE